MTSTTLGTDDTLKSSAALLGHITLTAYDENGEIKNYRQTDNVVVNTGDNCILMDILSTSSGSCATASQFNVVHLGTGTTTMSEGSVLQDMTWNRVTTGTVGALTAASSTGGASATVTATFPDVSATITEAALMNSQASNTANILAMQDFADIALGSTDDLTVQWTITVDGS